MGGHGSANRAAREARAYGGTASKQFLADPVTVHKCVGRVEWRLTLKLFALAIFTPPV